MSGAKLLLLLIAFMAWTRKKLHFFWVRGGAFIILVF
jgi:hypothetical protein